MVPVQSGRSRIVVIVVMQILANAIETVNLVVDGWESDVLVTILRMVNSDIWVFAHTLDIFGGNVNQTQVGDVFPCDVDLWAWRLRVFGTIPQRIVDASSLEGEIETVKKWCYVGVLEGVSTSIVRSRGGSQKCDVCFMSGLRSVW